jgi:hypothetical protein
VILCLLISRTRDIQVGILSDGRTWKIFMMKQYEQSGFLLYDSGDLTANDRKSVTQILGISSDSERLY